MRKFFVFALAAWGAASLSLPAQAQTEFKKPEQAAKALYAASLQKGDKAMLALFGPDAQKVMDPTPQGREETRRILALLFKERWKLSNLEEDRKILRMGDEGWPFPVSLAKGPAGWHFDTASGVEEILNRRVGRNELINIETLGNVIEAENSFKAKEGHYTNQFASSAGKHDGLYWARTAKQPASPLEAALKNAAKYAIHRVEGAPWFGYRYRFLPTPDNSSWAVVAYPATYGSSGVMSFLCNQEGKIYQRDLGADSVKVVDGLDGYDTSDGWEPVDPESLRR